MEILRSEKFQSNLYPDRIRIKWSREGVFEVYVYTSSFTPSVVQGKLLVKREDGKDGIIIIYFSKFKLVSSQLDIILPH